MPAWVRFRVIRHVDGVAGSVQRISPMGLVFRSPCAVVVMTSIPTVAASGVQGRIQTCRLDMTISRTCCRVSSAAARDRGRRSHLYCIASRLSCNYAGVISRSLTVIRSSLGPALARRACSSRGPSTRPRLRQALLAQTKLCYRFLRLRQALRSHPRH